MLGFITVPTLLVISSAPATLNTTTGAPFLDIKFSEGMARYAALWDGPVRAILCDRGASFPFGREMSCETLPFDLEILPGPECIDYSKMAAADVVLCSGDNHAYLHLADLCAAHRIKIAYTIEYIPETRRQIAFLDRSRSWPRKIYSAAWNMRQELRRRHAFTLADGLQANGYPAETIYRQINGNILKYLDNRLTKALLVSESERAARRAHLREGLPLRIISSGRLEPMKGAQDLIPIARDLTLRGVKFELDIFGYGSLWKEIEKGAADPLLAGRVRLHAPVDFETELVPFARRKADIFLSCNRQSDPSCSYIENMGCGLPIVGYGNRMWSALRDASRAGWVSPLGDWQNASNTLADLSTRREAIVEAADAAVDFASAHLFEDEFARRIDHLTQLV